jgi:hypothetical protein
MVDDNSSSSKDCRDRRGMGKHGGSGIAGGVFFVAFIGAAVYFIQQATSFGTGVLGFLKAIIWPYFLIYHLLEFLNL